MRRVPVLVVGGALTGLSAAVFLAWHGVPCLLVECRGEVLAHPRLRGLHPRTVELFRQVGLEEAILARSAGSAAAADLVSVRADTLASAYERLVEPGGSPEGRPDVSPCAFAPIGQDDLEVLLREHAEQLGAEVRFGTEACAVEPHADGVTVVLRDHGTGTEERVHADYVIAADGAGSAVRRALGVGSDGHGTFFHMLTAYVAADLRPALRGRQVNMAYLRRPARGTVLGLLDETAQHWFFGTAYRPASGESIVDVTAERCGDLVRAAAGLPDVPVELLPQVPGGPARPQGFPIGARVARSYRVGRVFLAGDAAHLMPPTGALGGATCVQDAHNLAWKLAWVLDGRAGAGLLDTYHAERHPVGLRTMRQALARARHRWDLPAGDDEPIEDDDAVSFGYRYSSTAALAAPVDGLLAPQYLAGQSGTRAPHVAVEADTTLSTLDLYGRELVLLAGPGGDAWESAASHAAELWGVPVETYHLDVALAEAHGLAAGAALLVRPDGFVAWRGTGPAPDPGPTVERVLRTILAR